MQTKKKKMLTTGLAVALAALLLIGGGTFAYLQSESKAVANQFKTNEVQVELTESGNGQYNIIPGTSETKDPKVTVENTVDAYVFVEVTDKTDGLVTYDIADGWELLNGYDNVYYREVDEDADVKEFYVLKENKVTYSAALENSNMLDANGTLKTGIELTFKASAIQQEGFTSALHAYKNEPAVLVDSIADLKAQISNSNIIALSDDIIYDSSVDSDIDTTSKRITISKTLELDLSGHNITFDSNEGNNNWALFYVNAGRANLAVNGEGTIDATANTGAYCFHLTGGQLSKPTLTINGGTYIGNPTAVNVQYGTAYINGGFFNCKPAGTVTEDVYRYTLNCIDANYKNGTAKIIVTGGTFVNFNPADNQAEGVGTNFVAEGYHVEQETKENGEIWYTVVKD